MDSVTRGSFNHLRYVVAGLGCVAFVLLFILKDLNIVVSSQYWQYNNASFKTHYILTAIRIVILTLIGIFSNNLPAKWIIVVPMVSQASLLFFYALSSSMRHDGLTDVVGIFANINWIISPGVALIAMHSIIAKWSRPSERILITTIIYSGIPAAHFFLNISGILIYKVTPSVILGLFCIMWVVTWCIVVNDSPRERNRFISNYEKYYIQTSIEQRNPEPNCERNISNVILSKPFIAIVLVECSNVLIQAILLQLLVVSFRTLPYGPSGGLFMTQLFVLLACGILATVLLQRKVLSFDLSRKIPSIIAIILPLPLIIVLFLERSVILFKVCRFLAHTIIGIRYCGAIVNIIDISPNFAGFLMAIVLVISEATTALMQGLISFFDMHLNITEDIIVIPPVIVFAIGSAIVYCFWGSTEQKTSIHTGTMTLDNTRSGKVYSYGPVRTTQPDESSL